MRKIILSLLILIFAFVLSCFAQSKQRLGIKPQEINLDKAQGSSAIIEAYCFDRHVFVDGKYDYSFLHTDESAINVFVGNQKYSLSEAIKNKKIKVTGRIGERDNNGELLPGEFRLVIEITKLVPEKVTVKVEKASVFRNTPGTYQNQKALDVLSSSDSSLNRDVLQDAVWAADIDRSRLESLGYKSVEEFQKENGLKVSKDYNPETTAKLAQVESDFIYLFEKYYLGVVRRDTKINSITDNIARLQGLYEVEITGNMSSGIYELFKRYETEYIPKIRELESIHKKSGKYVFRIEPSFSGKSEYTFYSQYKAFKIKDNSELIKVLIDWTTEFEDSFVVLEGISPEKVEGLKTSMNIQSLSMFNNDTTKGKFFLIDEVSQFVSSSPIVKIGQDFRSTLVYKTVQVKTNQRMNVTAKVRDTVLKFVDNFKKLVNGKRDLASIVSEARKKSGAVRLGFGQLGEIEIIELFREKPFELITE